VSYIAHQANRTELIHFRMWHKCEVPRRPLYFRFLGKSGSDTDSPVRSKMTQAV